MKIPRAGHETNPDLHPDYRPDIDGLRAIAVLSVICFHAFPRWLPGGFVGVDIFFVISGFLISTIILRGLFEGRFSYIEFYAQRIRRIFPALLLVLGCCVVFAWFTLYALEYKALGRHVAGGAAFVANILLWQEAGYFDVARYFKPLLHLWSLGVEEQFYIFWPLLLALFWRATHKLLPIIVLVLLISFAANIVFVGVHPAAVFFLSLCRGWELMIGAIVAYSFLKWGTPLQTDPPLRRALTEAVAWIGLSMLAATLFIDEDVRFPGWWALLPVIGTASLIAAGPTCFINRRALAARPLVLVGLISYPAYLWHWPLLSFGRIFNYGPLPGPTRIALVLVTFVLAWVTYRLIERPIRSKRKPIAAVVLCVLGIAVFFVGLLIYLGGGLEFRTINAKDRGYSQLIVDSKALDSKLRRAFERKTSACWGLPIGIETQEFCSSYGPSGGATSTVVIWGDSHAEAWAPVFYQIADDQHLRVIMFIHKACPPLVGVRMPAVVANVSNCSSLDTGEAIVTAIKALKPSRIFLIGRWSIYTHGWILEGELQRHTHFITADPRSEASEASSKSAMKSQLMKTLDVLTTLGPVTVFKTMPSMYSYVERGLLRTIPLEPTAQEHARFESLSNNVIDAAQTKFLNLTVFDPGAVTCELTCRAILNDTLLYTDDNHVSAQGALLFEDSLWQGFFPATRH